MNNIKKAKDILILIFLAYLLVKIIPSIGNSSFLETEKLLVLNSTVLAIGFALITMLRDIYKDYFNKLKGNQKSYTLLTIVIYSINLNIKRMICSIFAISLLYISENSSIILIKFNSQRGLDTFDNTYRISIVFYLLVSTLDIIVSALKLYEAELTHE